MFDDDECWQAMQTRDARFDGAFFVAVKTTGIYCRPVCKARMPQRKNIVFVRSAAEAERLGFRPCLRCRPETAPFCPAWRGTRATVDRALRIIEEGFLDAHGVDEMADRLGIGSRHLSRLFAEHLGASPAQVAISLRVQRAKRLLNSSDRPLSEIAIQAGFGSVRSFNETFRKVYQRSPSSLRTGTSAAE
ncbi:MAG: Ada metal-binding domain-containing protein [Pseudomonadota bacterium]